MDRGEAIRDLMRLQDELIRRRAAWDVEPWLDLEMSTPQLKALLLIAEEDRMRMRELARRLGGSFSNATVLVDRLVDRGLVERMDEPEDRRVVLVRVSEKGRRVIEGLVTSWRTITPPLLERLSSEDLDALARGLRALLEASERQEEEAGRRDH
jgi:DNA-binding MarR family transcriptional regulator